MKKLTGDNIRSKACKVQAVHCDIRFASVSDSAWTHQQEIYTDVYEATHKIMNFSNVPYFVVRRAEVIMLVSIAPAV